MSSTPCDRIGNAAPRGSRPALLIGLLALAGAGSDAAAQQLIVAYDVGGNPPASVAASESGAGVTALPLSLGSGVTTGNTELFDGTGFTTSDAPDPNDYFEWGWSNAPPLDLAALDIAYRRANTNGPRMLRIDLSTNGGAFQPVFSDATIASTPVAGGEQNLGIDLSAFDAVTSATFRLFAWASDGTSGSQLEVHTFQTSPARGIAVSAVPEPSAALAALVIGSTWAARRRRK